MANATFIQPAGKLTKNDALTRVQTLSAVKELLEGIVDDDDEEDDDDPELNAILEQLLKEHDSKSVKRRKKLQSEKA